MIWDERGMAVVEFALVAPLFFLLMLSILELGITLFAQSVMDGAARDAARLIRTGQAQGQNAQNLFTNQLCLETAAVVPCNNMIFVVESFATFGQLNLPGPDQNGNPPAPVFQPGAAGSVVGVRVFYNRPFIVPLVGRYLSPGGNGNVLLTSTVVFRNEPF